MENIIIISDKGVSSKVEGTMESWDNLYDTSKEERNNLSEINIAPSITEEEEQIFFAEKNKLINLPFELAGQYLLFRKPF